MTKANTQRETGILRPMRYAETQRAMRETSMVRKQASADKSGRDVQTRPLSTAATSDLRSEHASELRERRVNVRIVRKRTLRTKKMTSGKLAPKMASSKLAPQRRLEERPPMRACATNNVRNVRKSCGTRMKTAAVAVHGLEVERRQRRLHSEQDLDGSDALGTNGLETLDSNVRNLTQPTGARAAEAPPRERSLSYRAELEPGNAATRLEGERITEPQLVGNLWTRVPGWGRGGRRSPSRRSPGRLSPARRPLASAD